MVSVLAVYYRTPRVLIAALLYFLIAGALTQVPLFNYLGYEFSALMTLPVAFISGIISIQFLREHRSKSLPRRTWLKVIIDYLHINFLLLLIPLIIISFNAFAVKNCNFIKGIAYYVLLPISTMIFSVSLSLVIGTIFRKAILVFSIVVVGILCHILFITYNQPQLFAYNFILGYFPGITYDDTINNKNTLIIFREFTLIASLMLISLFFILVVRFNYKKRWLENIRTIKKYFREDKKLWSIAGICLVILTVGHVYRNNMGYEFTADDIKLELGRRTESDHFIFFYSPENYTAEEMKRMKSEGEFYLTRLSTTLQLRNADKKKINIFIYPNSELKKKLIGTSNTNIAKPWRYEIHLTAGTYESSFRHELVHVLASDFGFPIIHASTRLGLNEGLAVAIEWDEGIHTPHEYAASLQREKLLGDVSQLFTISGFITQTNTYAYIVAGSFCKYLIDRYGIDRFKKVFPNGAFVEAFGERRESLIKDWKVFLRTIDTDGIPASTVQTLFLQPSIFYRTCAREVAENNERAVHAIQIGNYVSAEKDFGTSYQNAPSAYALRGLFYTYIAQKKNKRVIESYGSLSNQSLLKYNPSIILYVGDSYFMNHLTNEALQCYAKLREMNINERYNETAAVRLQLVREKCPPEILFNLNYSQSSDSVKVAMLNAIRNEHIHESSFLYYYALYQKEGSEEQINAFQSALASNLNSDLRYSLLRRTADLLYKKNNFEESKIYYWQAKNYVPTQACLAQLDERIELCDAVGNDY